MPAAIVARLMLTRLLRPEIRNRKRAHVSDNFAMSKVQPCLAITDERRKSNHSESYRRARRELHVDYLVVTYVVFALINAFPIWISRRERVATSAIIKTHMALFSAPR